MTHWTVPATLAALLLLDAAVIQLFFGWGHSTEMPYIILAFVGMGLGNVVAAVIFWLIP